MPSDGGGTGGSVGPNLLSGASDVLVLLKLDLTICAFLVNLGRTLRTGEGVVHKERLGRGTFVEGERERKGWTKPRVRQPCKGEKGDTKEIAGRGWAKGTQGSGEHRSRVGLMEMRASTGRREGEICVAGNKEEAGKQSAGVRTRARGNTRARASARARAWAYACACARARACARA
eukprot:2482992-Pleurochrysis_carterae.AAC.2